MEIMWELQILGHQRQRLLCQYLERVILMTLFLLTEKWMSCVFITEASPPLKSNNSTTSLQDQLDIGKWTKKPDSRPMIHQEIQIPELLAPQADLRPAIPLGPTQNMEVV